MRLSIQASRSFAEPFLLTRSSFALVSIHPLYFDEISFAGDMEWCTAGNDDLLTGFDMSCPAGGINRKANHRIHAVGLGNQQRDNPPAQRQKIQGRFVWRGGDNQLLRPEA